MTPRQAMKKNCEICLEGTGLAVSTHDCPSTLCPLNKVKRGEEKFRVKLLREFCLHCNGGSIKAVDECTGIRLHTDFENLHCPFHPFRDGKLHGTRRGLSEGSKKTQIQAG